MSGDFDNEANEVGVAFATSWFRLLKGASMREVKNLLAQGALEGAAQQLREQAKTLGGFVVMMFAGESVFVNGQPLKSPRSVYENILFVGESLQAREYNEITVRTNISANDLAAVLDYIVNNVRPTAMPSAISLTYVDPAKILAGGDDHLSMLQKVAGTYGAAIVLVRRCDVQIREDNPTLMRHVKRVAQRMVTLSHDGFPEWLALARRPSPPTDHARIAVNSAVIGVLAARVLTDDIHVLLRITMAALQAEIGKPRVAGMYREDTFQTSFVPQLNKAMRERLPASTALMLLQAGRAADRPMMRAVAAYETAQLSDGAVLGWPYEGHISPTVESIIASMALRVAYTMATSKGPDELVREMAELEVGKVERAGIELIYSVLGLVPRGTPVQLTTGCRGVVVSAGDSFAELERATFVLLLDQNRHPVSPTVISASEGNGWITRAVLEPDELLNQEYEKWVARTPRLEEGLPATTGVLAPDAADSLQERATLNFDPSEATNVLDSMAVERAVAEMPAEISGKRSSQADPRTVLSPPGSPAAEQPASTHFQTFQKPTEQSASTHFQTFQKPTEQPAPSQFQKPAEPPAPAQFQQPAQPAEPTPSQFQQPANVPKQFQSNTSEAPSSSFETFNPTPKQFAASAPSAAPKKFETFSKPGEQSPTAQKPSPAGAWVRPDSKGKGAKEKAVQEPEKEPDKKDDSSDDGDFDALKNIVLFD